MSFLSTLAPIAGSLLGGIFGSDAAEDAADMQYAASQRAIEEQQRQYNQSRADLAPWREAGASALQQLQQFIQQPSNMQPFTGEGLTEDPGYQFGMDEGEKAINRNMAARGMLNSGAALKSLQRFNQDYAGTKFNEAFNRNQASKNQAYNMLAGVSGTGQTSANQTAQMGMRNAAMIGNYGLQGANSQAAGRIGGANAWMGALDDIGGYYRMQELLKG